MREDKLMNDTGNRDRPQSRVPRVATTIGLFAAFITAGAVSWATPDGNLVVTLVPAMAVGLAVFGIASFFRSHRHFANKIK